MTRAIRGQFRMSKRFIFFWRSVSVMTADGLTSLPVPAVVGMARTGRGSCPQRPEVLPVARVAAVGQQQGDTFRRVDRRAAADRDEDVDPCRTREVGADQAVDVTRVEFHLLEEGDVQTHGHQFVPDRCHQAGRLHAWIGNNHHPPAPKPGGVGSHLTGDPPAEENPRGQVELAVSGHAQAAPAEGRVVRLRWGRHGVTGAG